MNYFFKTTIAGIFFLLIINFSFAQYSVFDENETDGLYCPVLSKYLKLGYRDANTLGQVSELQQFLVDYYDLDTTELSITGIFGKVTKGHVMNFQKDNGLVISGLVGLPTRNKIAQVCTIPSTSTPTPPPTPTPTPISTTTATTSQTFSYSWDTSAWGSCSYTGVKTRTTICKSNTGNIVSDNLCTEIKPATSESCTISLSSKTEVENYLKNVFGSTVTTPGAVVVLPSQVGPNLPGLVILPDGSPLNVSNSKTSGIQEAYDYALLNGWDLFIYGRGKYDIKNTNGKYIFSEPLNIKATQGKTVRIYNADFVFASSVSQYAIKFDSLMMIDWEHTGKVEAPNTEVGLWFQPENGHPLDGNLYGTIGNVATRFKTEEVLAKTTGVKVNTATPAGLAASTNGVEFYFGSIKASGNTQSIQVVGTAWSSSVVYGSKISNLISFEHDALSPNAVVVIPPTGTGKIGKVLKPDGTQLAVSSSETAGIQEAINLAMTSNSHLVIYGRGLDLNTIVRDAAGKPTSWGSEGVYKVSKSIQFPVMNNKLVKIWNVTIWDAPRNIGISGDGLIRFDGGEGNDVELTGQVFSKNMSFSFKFEPNSAPLKNNLFRLSTGSSVQYSTYFTSIENNKFYFNELLGWDLGGNLGSGIGVNINSPNKSIDCFCNNLVSASFVHGHSILGVQVGQVAANSDKIYNNTINVNVSPDNKNQQVGLQVWGKNNTINTEIYGGGRGISFEPSSSGNTANVYTNLGTVKVFEGVPGANIVKNLNVVPGTINR